MFSFLTEHLQLLTHMKTPLTELAPVVTADNQRLTAACLAFSQCFFVTPIWAQRQFHIRWSTLAHWMSACFARSGSLNSRSPVKTPSLSACSCSVCNCSATGLISFKSSSFIYFTETLFMLFQHRNPRANEMVESDLHLDPWFAHMNMRLLNPLHPSNCKHIIQCPTIQ